MTYPLLLLAAGEEYQVLNTNAIKQHILYFEGYFKNMFVKQNKESQVSKTWLSRVIPSRFELEMTGPKPVVLPLHHGTL